MICFKKNWKNQIFSFFFFKMDADLLSSNGRFSNLCQKILKLSSPVLWKGFEVKSHQRRAHYLNPLRNGGRLTTRGGSRSPPPPVWLGLSQWHQKYFCQMKMAKMLPFQMKKTFHMIEKTFYVLVILPKLLQSCVILLWSTSMAI